ncbi:MAG: hypothetical protein HKO56_02865 [Bacteroidia bacterium]|nr:hypothetical protein [Bacteroidia bacterium]NNC85108.1 hypothetical protein [Bacteroidia bacterium]NNM15575.1 hypothetical protein [Bacteroidia bacterium]
MRYLAIVLILTTTLLGQQCFAQKTIKEWSESPDKSFNKKSQYLNHLGFLKNSIKQNWVTPDQIPPIKEAGILSFVVIQPTFTKKSGSSIYTKYLTSAGSGRLSDVLFPIVMAGMKTSFEEKGISVFIPEEYCDTEEKKTLFDEVEFEPSKLMKASAAIASYIRSPQMKDDPTGYMGKFVTMANSDYKVSRAIGKFSKEMDMDLLITYEQTIWFDGKTMTLGPITICLIGPNPTPETDKTSYAPMGPLKGYMEGFVFASVTKAPPKAYELGVIKKKNIIWSDLDGLELIYKRISDNLIDYMNTEFDNLKK